MWAVMIRSLSFVITTTAVSYVNYGESAQGGQAIRAGMCVLIVGKRERESVRGKRECVRERKMYLCSERKSEKKLS